jgi:type IV secretion system protein VirD4
MSAAQLVDAYRFPAVQAADRRGLDPRSLLRGGTLYLIAPESEQEMLAPLFGGILGSVLRACEEQAARVGRDPSWHLRILADEAAHLTPLAKLPTYLAVSGGWGVRWCLVYQSLSQLQHRYGGEADGVLGNALCKLFLGPIQDEATRRYLVELLDEETAMTSSFSSDGLGLARSRTRHERSSPKVSAQRLMQLEPGRAVVVHGRDLPALTRLPAWWERRDRR